MASVARGSARAGIRASFALTLAASLVLAACENKTVDLQSVRDFGKATQAAAGSFEDVSSDYYASCLRYREYRGETRLGTRPLTDIPSYPAIVPMPTAPASPARANAAGSIDAAPSPEGALPPAGADDRDCAASLALARRWSLENTILVDYVAALAAVAGVGTSPNRATFEALGTSLRGAGIVSSDATAKAGGDLAAAIVASLLRRRQEDDVAAVAMEAQVPLDQLTDGLEQAALIYRLTVRNELAELNSSRILLISLEARRLGDLRVRAGLPRDSPVDAGASAPERGASPEETVRLLAVLALRERIAEQRERWQADARDAARRANMAADYYRAIAAIRKTHDALVKTRGGLRAVVATVRPLVDELIDPVAALAPASAQAK